MMINLPLSRMDQFALNGRAFLRDLARGNLRKARFHFRGLCRALIAC
jgi:hypothetical protein